MTVREMFEAILELCKEHGIEKTKITIDSIFEMIEMLEAQKK